MKRPVVIVRTVSIEKLASVVEACRGRWPGHPIWIVTNPARVEEVSRFVGVSRAIPYSAGSDGFEAPIGLEDEIASVVVPVANEGGSGYANVMRATRALKAGERALCSRCQRLVFRSRLAWEMTWRWEIGMREVARFFGRFWAERMLERDGAWRD